MCIHAYFLNANARAAPLRGSGAAPLPLRARLPPLSLGPRPRPSTFCIAGFLVGTTWASLCQVLASCGWRSVVLGPTTNHSQPSCGYVQAQRPPQLPALLGMRCWADGSAINVRRCRRHLRKPERPYVQGARRPVSEPKAPIELARFQPHSLLYVALPLESIAGAVLYSTVSGPQLAGTCEYGLVASRQPLFS